MFWLNENISLRLLYSKLSFGSEEMISQSPVNVIKQWVSILCHYTDVIMSAMVPQITCVSIIWSIICSGADQRKHPSSASLAFVKEIHRWPMDSPHKGPVTRKIYPFGNVIMVLFQIWWKRVLKYGVSLRWRHNDHAGVSNHQPNGCLLNRLFRLRSMKTSKLRVTGLCVGNSPGPVNSPHKGPVTRKIFPFDDVIMSWRIFVNLENAAEMVSPVIFISVVELLLNFYYYGVMCKISKRFTNWAIK